MYHWESRLEIGQIWNIPRATCSIKTWLNRFMELAASIQQTNELVTESASSFLLGNREVQVTRFTSLASNIANEVSHKCSRLYDRHWNPQPAQNRNGRNIWVGQEELGQLHLGGDSRTLGLWRSSEGRDHRLEPNFEECKRCVCVFEFDSLSTIFVAIQSHCVSKYHIKDWPARSSGRCLHFIHFEW